MEDIAEDPSSHYHSEFLQEKKYNVLSYTQNASVLLVCSGECVIRKLSIV